MPLAVGSRIAHYDVTALIGEGGMGQVYQATDTKLGREVALKILPEAFATDPDRLARFQREAQVLASLNHPGIAAIYGIEEQDDTRALVLELVEGPTLADRISKGAIPLDEALPIAKQIAEALEAAHEAGVIHRDLKPANIKVKPDGTVKVLDFGLAKALDPSPTGDPSQSPTLTAAATQMGVIMGTAAYMSPEQAAGKPVDKRSDIWSFGVVFFEMLTGQRLYTGETVAHVLARVLDREPDLGRLPAPTPSFVDHLLRRCLEKHDKRRLRDIGEAVLMLGDARSTAMPPAALTGEAQPGRGRLLPWALSSVGVVSLAAAVLLTSGGTGESTRLETRQYELGVGPMQGIPAGDERIHLAFSPDGRQLAYVKRESGVNLLYLRDLEQGTTRRLPGTEGAYTPFFSPDGDWIGYHDVVERTLERVLTQGGEPVQISSMFPGGGAVWLADETIIFGSQPMGEFGTLLDPASLYRVGVDGGVPEPLIELDEQGGRFHVFPVPLSADTIAFHSYPPELDISQGTLELFRLETGERRTLLTGITRAVAVASGHLVFTRGSDLWAVAFDMDRFEVVGDEVLLVPGIEQGFQRSFAISGDGSLVYLPGESVAPAGVLSRSLVWVDREGAEQPLAMAPGQYYGPALSPDGTRVALTAFDGEDFHAWVYETATGRGLRVTDRGGHRDMQPTWDAERLIFSEADGMSGTIAFPGHLAAVASDGGGGEELLQEEGTDIPTSVSPDGQTLFFTRTLDSGGTERELWSLSLEDGQTQSLYPGVGSSGGGAISPDGRWLAYWSDQTGQSEVYIQAYPSGGARTSVSIDGGDAPKWSPAGGELYFIAGPQMMAVEVETEGALRVGRPFELFDRSSYYRLSRFIQYDVAPDGRFLMIKRSQTRSDATVDHLVVIANWVEELKERVPIP